MLLSVEKITGYYKVKLFLLSVLVYMVVSIMSLYYWNKYD